MRKVLIADGSEIFASALEDALRTQYQVQVCADGATARDLLSHFQPDVLILNLQLPHTDGLTLLQTAPFQPPVILAMTMHMSAYVEQSIAALGVDYTMICPSVETVVLQLQNLLKCYDSPEAQPDPHSKAAQHLHLLGFPTHLDGYQQLCIALPLFAQNPQQLMTKELYPAVAKLCNGKDGRAVEHSIRKAIRVTWEHRDNAVWRKYFASGPRGHIPCPTNKAFICRLAEILTME